MKSIKNIIYILKYVHKSGKVVFVIILTNILFNTAWTYVGTNMGLWVFDAVSSMTIQNTIVGIVIIYVVTMFFQMFLSWFATNSFPIAMTRVTEYITNELIKKIFDVRQNEVENSQFYDKYTRAISEIQNRPSEVLQLLSNIIGGILQLFTVIIVVSKLSIKYMLIFVFASLICSIISIFTNEVEYKKYEEATKVNRKLSYINRVIYLPEFGRTLRSNINYRELLTNCYTRNSDDMRQIIKNYHSKLYLLKIFNDMVYLTFFGLTPWLIAITELYNHTMTVGEVTVIMGATAYLPDICNALFGAIVSIRKHSLYINNLRSILEYKSVRVPDEQIRAIDKYEGIVDTQNVSFSYSLGSPLIIREVNLKIRKCEKVAFVGVNGAGKTTLACLLAGLYSATEGFVYLDGKNIDKMCLQSISKKVIMVNQEKNMFSVSIAENVLQRPLRTTKDYELVEDALKKVGMYDKINGLKNGVDTCVSKEFDSEGIILSGGEMQKLAIARVYVSEAEFVIMDEPTSALDAISESEIMKLLFELLKERTIVIISHRLSVVTAVDTICYIDKGHIAEKGSHTELMQKKGKYYSLYKAQADKYQII